jgi:hypothetical protein
LQGIGYACRKSLRCHVRMAGAEHGVLLSPRSQLRIRWRETTRSPFALSLTSGTFQDTIGQSGFFDASWSMSSKGRSSHGLVHLFWHENKNFAGDESHHTFLRCTSRTHHMQRISKDALSSGNVSPQYLATCTVDSSTSSTLDLFAYTIHNTYIYRQIPSRTASVSHTTYRPFNAPNHLLASQHNTLPSSTPKIHASTRHVRQCNIGRVPRPPHGRRWLPLRSATDCRMSPVGRYDAGMQFCCLRAPSTGLAAEYAQARGPTCSGSRRRIGTRRWVLKHYAGVTGHGKGVL